MAKRNVRVCVCYCARIRSHIHAVQPEIMQFPVSTQLHRPAAAALVVFIVMHSSLAQHSALSPREAAGVAYTLTAARTRIWANKFMAPTQPCQ